MTDLLTIAGEVLAELFRSDVDGHIPDPVYSWLATTVAHFGMGMMVALSPARRFAADLLTAYLVKEAVFDLRIDAFAFVTLLDCAADSYTIEEAATTLGVSVGSVRAWVKAGLPIMTKARPYLILGDALRTFLDARRTLGKVRLLPDQFYCLRCKAGRRPMGLMVDVLPQSPTTARLFGLCDECGSGFNRMISLSQIDRIRPIFVFDFKDTKQA